MTMTKDEASAALGEIAAARGRVFQAKAYGAASPFLMIWGAVWLGADLASQFEPSWTLAWPSAVVAGALASFAAGFTLPRATAMTGEARLDWRNFAIWGVVMAFITALFVVLPPVSGRVLHSIFGLLFGFLYTGMGLWMGWRLAALGLALVALTFVAFFLIGPWYAAFMGVVCGGGLILGGFWLRRV